MFFYSYETDNMQELLNKTKISYPDPLISLFAVKMMSLYKGNHQRNHKLWNVVSTERYTIYMQVMLLHINEVHNGPKGHSGYV
jgi:hypothetical protein